jgi:hypothetical protein
MSLRLARMCRCPRRDRLTAVTVWLVDAGLIAATLLLWAFAARTAAALPFARTPREMSERAGRALAAIGAGLAVTLAQVAVFVATGLAGAALGRDALALPPLLLATVFMVLATIPRLTASRRSARAFGTVSAMAPALRYAAAHPLLGWPVQVVGFAIGAGQLVVSVGRSPMSLGIDLAALAGFVAAAAVSGLLLRHRYRRLAADVIVPVRRLGFIPRRTAIGAAVLAAVMALLAAVATAPSAAAASATVRADVLYSGLSTGDGE